MTDENIQNLLGGFATGTLTDHERDLLFTAALKDQELFNALADEQVLRDLLDDPATRRRLLQSLQPAEPGLRDRLTAWMRSPAIWATAGVAVRRPGAHRLDPPCVPAAPAGVEMARAVPAPQPPAVHDAPKEERSARPAKLALKREAEAPAKMKVAVLEFDADPAQAKEAQAASESIEKKLDSSGYAVIDRKRIDEALQAGNLNNRQLDNSAAA